MDTKSAGYQSGMPAGEAARIDGMNMVLAANWWAVALRGVFGILFGIVALLLPGAAMLSLVLVFAAYMLVDGIFAIIAGIRAARLQERWGWLVFEGAVDLIAGAVALLWPAITVLAFVLLLAAWSLVSGGLELAAAVRLKQEHGRWWLVLGGAASIVFGVLLVIAPLIGALVLTWWFGAYALVFGVSLLVVAFKLRIQNMEHPRSAQPA
jgi:uncharacterized membrane protein HdeD (DUF308 family)